MTASANCGICNAANVDELESLGRAAERGDISWRQAARDGGLPHHQALKNHMERHAVSETMAEAMGDATAEWAGLVAETIEGLKAQMRSAPAELKALYLVAIRNCMSIDLTKPSQANLVGALKAIQEITGMKAEQRFMLQFANAMAGALVGPGSGNPALPPAAESANTQNDDDDIVDAEVVE